MQNPHLTSDRSTLFTNQTTRTQNYTSCTITSFVNYIPFHHPMLTSRDLLCSGHGHIHVHVRVHVHVPYLSNEGNSDAGVGSNQPHKDLSTDVSEEVFYVLSDKVVLHDGLPMGNTCIITLSLSLSLSLSLTHTRNAFSYYIYRCLLYTSDAADE